MWKVKGGKKREGLRWGKGKVSKTWLGKRGGLKIGEGARVNGGKRGKG